MCERERERERERTCGVKRVRKSERRRERRASLALSAKGSDGAVIVILKHRK